MRPGALTGASGLREIVDDIGMRAIERASCGVVAIALFGDGEGDDADAGFAHCSISSARCVVASRTSRIDPMILRLDPAGVGDREGVEEVLRLERIADVGLLERGADDAPARLARQQAVDIDGHVCPVKRAGAQMHDAGRHGRPVVAQRARAALSRAQARNRAPPRCPLSIKCTDARVVKLFFLCDRPRRRRGDAA